MLENIVLISAIDPEPLLEEIAESGVQWGKSVRTTFKGTAHGEVEDILLRYTEVNGARPLSWHLDSLDTVSYPAWDTLHAVRNTVLDLMRAVEGIRLGKVVLTKLPPGGSIAMHVDEGLYADTYTRYHIVLDRGEGSDYFYVNREMLDLDKGGVYVIDVTLPHAAANATDRDRVHLIVDILHDT